MVLHNSDMLLGDAELITAIHTINHKAGYLNDLFHILACEEEICGGKTLLEVKEKFIQFFYNRYVIKY